MNKQTAVDKYQYLRLLGIDCWSKRESAQPAKQNNPKTKQTEFVAQSPEVSEQANPKQKHNYFSPQNENQQRVEESAVGYPHSTEHPTTKTEQSNKTPTDASEQTATAAANSEKKPAPTINDFQLPSWAPTEQPQFNYEMPQICLHFIQISSELLIAYQADSTNNSGQTAEIALLRNMIKACGISSEGWVSNYFNWPQLPQDSTLNQNADVLRRSLRAHLEHRLNKQPVKFFLVLGESAGCYLLGRKSLAEVENFSQLCGKQLTTYTTPTLISITPQQMINHPQSRKQAWKDIKQLRAEVETTK